MKYQIIKVLIVGLLLIQFACENKKATATATDNNKDKIATTKKDTTPNPATTTEENGVTEKDTDVKSIEDFVPQDYQIRTKATGSLNGDAQEDVVLVLQKEEDVEANRIILLLIQKEDGYKKVAENDQAILCQECGGVLGDPFQKVIVKDDFFTIEHFGGSAERWARYSTFKYDATSQDWKWNTDMTVLTSAHDLDFKKTQKTETDNRSFVNFSIN